MKKSLNKKRHIYTLKLNKFIVIPNLCSNHSV